MPRKDDIKAVTNQIAANSEKDIEEPAAVDPRTLIPTGCTLLNCACSDDPRGAFAPGEIVNLIGDKSAGKTMTYLDMLAAVAGRKRFKDYKLVHRDVERRNRFNMAKLFGAKMTKRLGGGDIPTTMDGVIADVGALTKAGSPFIYGLDCFDALTDSAEIKRLDGIVKTGAPKKGSFQGAAKTKNLGFMLRGLAGQIADVNGLLFIISQVRENMDATSFQKYYRTGGKALGHNASHEIWLYNGGKLTRTVRGRERQIGVKACARITKNSITGKYRDVEFDIYYDYGVDDIGSNINFLLKEKFWHMKGQKIVSPYGTCTKPKLIDIIEEEGKEIELKKEVGTAWLEIEESMKLNRKRKHQ